MVPVTRRYWTPALEDRIDLPNVAAFTSAYRALPQDVVRRLSRSLQPIAIEVEWRTGLVRRFRCCATCNDGAFSARRIWGFYSQFRGDAGADEIAHCRAVGAHLRRHVHEVTPSAPWSWYSASAERFCGFSRLSQWEPPWACPWHWQRDQQGRGATQRVRRRPMAVRQPASSSQALQTGDLATAHRLIYSKRLRTRGVSRAVGHCCAKDWRRSCLAWRGALRTVRACFSADGVRRRP